MKPFIESTGIFLSFMFISTMIWMSALGVDPSTVIYQANNTERGVQ